ncbi:MAG: ribbon-helix-helix protein, CopG family, partial [Planctomycetales bacterium]|nr:ribbon-helix-helix protein, CopG family [Planctomycetales bacterium]
RASPESLGFRYESGMIPFTGTAPALANTTKFAASLPRELFARMERRRRRTRESRSAFVRRAIETLFRRWDEAALVKAYIEGYRRHPETPREGKALLAASAEALAAEPWE